MTDDDWFTTKRAYAWSGLFLGFCGGVFSLFEFDAGLIPIPAGAALGYFVGIGLHRTRSWPQERFFQRVLRQHVVWTTGLIALNDLARLAGLQSRDESIVWLSLIPSLTLLLILNFTVKDEFESPGPRDLRGSAILIGALGMCIVWYFAVEWYWGGAPGQLFQSLL